MARDRGTPGSVDSNFVLLCFTFVFNKYLFSKYRVLYSIITMPMRENAYFKWINLVLDMQLGSKAKCIVIIRGLLTSYEQCTKHETHRHFIQYYIKIVNTSAIPVFVCNVG